MADVTKEIALEVSLKDSTAQGTQSAKQRLREMQKELIAMAEAGQQGTDAFKRLEQQAGELKDEIGDVNQRIKNLASDTKTIDAFVGAVQGITAGFQIAQGAAALFGDENEDLQKALLKVQGAMALTTGVQQVANLLQKESAVMMGINTAATKLYAVVVGTATGALRAFRIALAATGIGAIVVVLGLAAEAMGLFSSKTDDATESQKDLKRAAEDTVGTLEFYERKLKANGATEADLAKLRRQTLINEKAELDRKLDEDVKRYGVRTDKYQTALRNEIDLLNVKIKEETQIIDAAAKEIANKEKAEQDRKNQQAKAQSDKQKAEIEKNTQARIAEQERLKLLDIEFFYERLELQKKFEADKEAVIVEGMQKEAAARKKATSALIATDKATKAGELQRESDLRAAQQSMADQSFSIIGDIITATAGQSEEAQRKAFNVSKAASIAQATINTFLGVTSALKMDKEVFPGQRFVQAALTLAAGLANVAKIKATQFQGGGGGGGGGSTVPAPAGGGSTTAPAQSFANPNTTMLGNQGQPVPQPQGSQPMRAYVVERDIQQTTSRVRRLSEFATLG